MTFEKQLRTCMQFLLQNDHAPDFSRQGRNLHHQAKNVNMAIRLLRNTQEVCLDRYNLPHTKRCMVNNSTGRNEGASSAFCATSPFVISVTLSETVASIYCFHAGASNISRLDSHLRIKSLSCPGFAFSASNIATKYF